MPRNYKKYELGKNKDITLQVVSYSEQMLVARVWFSGEGFNDPDHHHLNEEVDTVISGQFLAINGEEETILNPGDSVHVRPNEKHLLRLLSPTGQICSCWMPPREDLIEKFTELEE